jgi:SAM-dependent methyltransferase
MKNEDTIFKYWNEVLRNLPESYKQWFEAEKDFLRANTPRNSRVLEIGCGEGRSLSYIEGFGKLYGVDNNPQSVLQARERFNGNPEISISVDDGRRLSFRSDWFDRVLCLTTPANFGYEKPLFFREMRRLVRDDGEIILSVFNEDEHTFQERMKVYEKLGAPIIPNEFDHKHTVRFNYPGGASISQQYSEQDLRRELQSNGLYPIEITKQGIGYFCRAIK